jgi:hypothetical protein
VATAEAKDRLAGRRADEVQPLPDAPVIATPYTSVLE